MSITVEVSMQQLGTSSTYIYFFVFLHTYSLNDNTEKIEHMHSHICLIVILFA